MSRLIRLDQTGHTVLAEWSGEDPAGAEMPTMPAAALRIAGADYVVPLSGIAPLLNSISFEPCPFSAYIKISILSPPIAITELKEEIGPKNQF